MAGKWLGQFDVVEALRTAFPVATRGDFAGVGDFNYVYGVSGWMNSGEAAAVFAESKEDDGVPSVDIYIDGTRSDIYTADGTMIRPFKTFSAALAAVKQSSVLHISPCDYIESGSLVMPAFPIVIYGNGASLTVTGSVTFPDSDYVRYDLKTTISGGLIFAGTTAGRISIEGGSITGDVTFNGFSSLRSVTMSGGIITIADTAQVNIFESTISSTIASAGILIVLQCQFDVSSTISAVSSTTGVLFFIGNILIQEGTGAGVSISNGATGAYWFNYVANNLISTAGGVPIATGTSKTVLSKNNITGAAVTGTGFVGVNDDIIGANTVVKVGSDATGDMYYRNSDGILTRLPKGVDGQVLTMVAGLPAWANA